jgi:hypothetical protein
MKPRRASKRNSPGAATARISFDLLAAHQRLPG